MKQLVTAIVLAIVSPALAAAAGGNLYAAANGGFDKDLAGWSEPITGEVRHDPAAGEPAPGALAANAPSGSFSVAGPCVAVAPSTAYAASVRVRPVAGTIYVCGLSSFEHSDAACERDLSPFLAMARPLDDGWQTVMATGDTAATTRSVRLLLNCSGEPGFAVRFDDVVLAGP
jgi:hypothetical protein